MSRGETDLLRREEAGGLNAFINFILTFKTSMFFAPLAVTILVKLRVWMTLSYYHGKLYLNISKKVKNLPFLC